MYTVIYEVIWIIGIFSPQTKNSTVAYAGSGVQINYIYNKNFKVWDLFPQAIREYLLQWKELGNVRTEL